MAVHESGHALMGWATGGHLRRVIVPLWGFSRTDVSPNSKSNSGSLGGAIVGKLGSSAGLDNRAKAMENLAVFRGVLLDR